MTTNVGARVRQMTQTKETTATKVAAASGRMMFVDNLRVFLTILVVALPPGDHLRSEGSWFYTERPTTELASIVLTLFIGLCQFFFMGLFFLISGYFTPGSVDRKGSWQYIKDRLVRLGIPLVLFSLLVSPITEYFKAVTVYHNNPGTFVSIYIELLERRGLCLRPAVVRRSPAGLFPGLCPGSGHPELGKGLCSANFPSARSRNPSPTPGSWPSS